MNEIPVLQRREPPPDPRRPRENRPPLHRSGKSTTGDTQRQIPVWPRVVTAGMALLFFAIGAWASWPSGESSDPDEWEIDPSVPALAPIIIITLPSYIIAALLVYATVAPAGRFRRILVGIACGLLTVPVVAIVALLGPTAPPLGIIYVLAPFAIGYLAYRLAR